MPCRATFSRSTWPLCRWLKRHTAFQPIPVRRVVHQALLDMLDAMNQAGLDAFGSCLAIAHTASSRWPLTSGKWLIPTGRQISAPCPVTASTNWGWPLTSARPTWTTYIMTIFMSISIRTPEGQWLSKQAAYYGFALSYPAWATQITGYAFEPGTTAMSASVTGTVQSQYHPDTIYTRVHSALKAASRAAGRPGKRG